MDDRGKAKLVRDLVPEIIRRTGENPVVHRVSPQGLGAVLRAKLDDEVTEFDTARTADDRLAELADILEVVLGLAAADGASADDLERRRAAKAMERGRFTQGWMLESTE